MALSGDHVMVKMDDAGGTLRQFADGDITSVDLGLTLDQHDVTGFGDAVHNVINGQLQAPVSLKGFLTTTANTGTHTVIQGAFAAGAQVSLEVQVGKTLLRRAVTRSIPGNSMSRATSRCWKRAAR